MSVSPDGKLLASGGWDGVVKLWNTATLEGQGTIVSEPRMIWAVAFSPDGKTLATAGNTGSIKLWHTITHKNIGTLSH